MGARFGRASIPAMRAAPASPPRQAAKPRSVSASASRPRTSLPLDAALLAKASRIEQQLRELFPNPVVPLDHRNGFELLCAVVLSAQSTDKKVNEITPALFEAAREDVAATPHKMAGLGQARIKDLIKQIGLSNNKAKFLSELSKKLVEDFGGEIPATFEELESLPGIGHKSASVLMSQLHGVAAFPVDTHIHRLAARWGLSSGKNVKVVEEDLKAIFPEESWNDLHLQIIFYGREYGQARQKYPWPGPICKWAGLEDPPVTTPAKKKKRKPVGKEDESKARRRLL